MSMNQLLREREALRRKLADAQVAAAEAQSDVEHFEDELDEVQREINALHDAAGKEERK